jgi:hypothetical protein
MVFYRFCQLTRNHYFNVYVWDVCDNNDILVVIIFLVDFCKVSPAHVKVNPLVYWWKDLDVQNWKIVRGRTEGCWDGLFLWTFGCCKEKFAMDVYLSGRSVILSDCLVGVSGKPRLTLVRDQGVRVSTPFESTVIMIIRRFCWSGFWMYTSV